MQIISLFNNKGGVGKTTYLYHIAHLLSRKYKVLMIDCDSQCNLTAYCLKDSAIENAWKPNGNSIYRIVENLIEGLGDFKKRKPLELSSNLYLVPGDIEFSSFEDKLATTWVGSRGGDSSSLRLQSSIYRYIRYLSNEVHLNFDIVLLDLGPNLGSLNRSLLMSSDFFIVPAAPDLFSIRGTKNLGQRIFEWSTEWQQTQQYVDKVHLEIPIGKPKFLGYVAQAHNSRRGTLENMTQGWANYVSILETSINDNIIAKLTPLNQVFDSPNLPFKISQTPNLHSLVPYSMLARKPIFECRSSDGLTGAHIQKARDSIEYFEPILNYIDEII